MSDPITLISSMASQALLTELARSYELAQGRWVSVETAGGVHARKRVAAGEAFDVAVLASEAIDELMAAGHLVGSSKVDLACSGVALAVRTGVPEPDVTSEEALKRAVLAADNIGISTGPSGEAVMRLFERWGIAERVRGRVVTAAPGVPVGALVASGDVALGFQQRSELMHVGGITVLGFLPPAVQIVTTFSAAVCTASPDYAAARALIAFLASPATSNVKRRQGMAPP